MPDSPKTRFTARRPRLFGSGTNVGPERAGGLGPEHQLAYLTGLFALVRRGRAQQGEDDGSRLVQGSALSMDCRGPIWAGNCSL